MAAYAVGELAGAAAVYSTAVAAVATAAESLLVADPAAEVTDAATATDSTATGAATTAATAATVEDVAPADAAPAAGVAVVFATTMSFAATLDAFATSVFEIGTVAAIGGVESGADGIARTSTGVSIQATVFAASVDVSAVIEIAVSALDSALSIARVRGAGASVPPARTAVENDQIGLCVISPSGECTVTRQKYRTACVRAPGAYAASRKPDVTTGGGLLVPKLTSYRAPAIGVHVSESAATAAAPSLGNTGCGTTSLSDRLAASYALTVRVSARSASVADFAPSLETGKAHVAQSAKRAVVVMSVPCWKVGGCGS